MSFSATVHVTATTDIRVLPCTQLLDGRAVVFVVVDGLTIVARRWEDMQRLVLALHDGIADAKRGEDEPAKAILAGSGLDWSSAKPTASSGWLRHSRVRAERGAATPSSAEVEAAEEELIEAGGIRVRLQREAREQLRAEGAPLCRATVAVRACALLHAGRGAVDDPPTPIVAHHAVAPNQRAVGWHRRCALAKAAARLWAGVRRRDLMIGRADR